MLQYWAYAEMAPSSLDAFAALIEYFFSESDAVTTDAAADSGDRCRLMSAKVAARSGLVRRQPTKRWRIKVWQVA